MLLRALFTLGIHVPWLVAPLTRGSAFHPCVANLSAKNATGFTPALALQAVTFVVVVVLYWLSVA